MECSDVADKLVRELVRRTEEDLFWEEVSEEKLDPQAEKTFITSLEGRSGKIRIFCFSTYADEGDKFALVCLSDERPLRRIPASQELLGDAWEIISALSESSPHL